MVVLNFIIGFIAFCFLLVFTALIIASVIFGCCLLLDLIAKIFKL